MARLFTQQNTQSLLKDSMGLCVGHGLGKITPNILAHAIEADPRLVYRWRNGEGTPATFYMLEMFTKLPDPFTQHIMLQTGFHVERIREPGA